MPRTGQTNSRCNVIAERASLRSLVWLTPLTSFNRKNYFECRVWVGPKRFHGRIYHRSALAAHTILISRAARTRGDAVVILQGGIQTWIDVVVATFHVRGRSFTQVVLRKERGQWPLDTLAPFVHVD